MSLLSKHPFVWHWKMQIFYGGVFQRSVSHNTILFTLINLSNNGNKNKSITPVLYTALLLIQDLYNIISRKKCLDLLGYHFSFLIIFLQVNPKQAITFMRSKAVYRTLSILPYEYRMIWQIRKRKTKNICSDRLII